jgi:hypothetical protein
MEKFLSYAYHPVLLAQFVVLSLVFGEA